MSAFLTDGSQTSIFESISVLFACLFVFKTFVFVGGFWELSDNLVESGEMDPSVTELKKQKDWIVTLLFLFLPVIPSGFVCFVHSVGG